MGDCVKDLADSHQNRKRCLKFHAHIKQCKLKIYSLMLSQCERLSINRKDGADNKQDLCVTSHLPTSFFIYTVFCKLETYNNVITTKLFSEVEVRQDQCWPPHHSLNTQKLHGWVKSNPTSTKKNSGSMSISHYLK